MNKLLNYIKALLSPMAARPGSIHSTLQAVVNPEVTQNFVMPIDGWVSLEGEDPSDDYWGSCNMWVGGPKRLGTATSFNTNVNWAQRTIGFFNKGDTVYYGIQGTQNNTITIYNLIGGGIKSILQSGGELCLRLKNTLKLSHKVLACQSLTQPFFSKHPQSTTGLIHISHLQTERYTCMSPVVQGSTSPIHQQRLCKQLSSVMPVTLRSTQHFVSEQKKATQSLFTTPVLKQVRTFVAGLFPTQALNFAQGGAL